MVEVFRMLADATRVQVLWALVDREMSVNELAEHSGKPAPSVSQHLAKLRMARLVRTRRDGTRGDRAARSFTRQSSASDFRVAPPLEQGRV